MADAQDYNETRRWRRRRRRRAEQELAVEGGLAELLVMSLARPQLARNSEGRFINKGTKQFASIKVGGKGAKR